MRVIQQTEPTGAVRYQADKNFVIRVIAGETLLIPVGPATKNLNGMVMLNETGAFLWKALETPRTEDELVKQMLEEYRTDAPTALSDIKEFINSGIQNELISCV